MTTTPAAITRSVDHDTITLRSAHYAIDIIHRGSEHTRAGWQMVIDDDADGRGVGVRLHVYGRAGIEEIRMLMQAALDEMDEVETDKRKKQS